MSQTKERPSWMPETRQFSQQQENVVQRPEGLDAEGGLPVQSQDVRDGTIERYAAMQASPGRMDDKWLYTAQPLDNRGAEIVLMDEALAFTANSLLVDNWTNQWVYFPEVRRFIPPYSGGWILPSPKGFQKMRVQLKAPNPQYAPAAVIATEFMWVGWHEAYLPPMTGIINLVKTPVVA